MTTPYWVWWLTFICYCFLLYTSVECRRYDKCSTHGGRQGVCVVKRYCRETSVVPVQACDGGDTFCCPIPTTKLGAVPDVTPSQLSDVIGGSPQVEVAVKDGPLPEKARDGLPEDRDSDQGGITSNQRRRPVTDNNRPAGESRPGHSDLDGSSRRNTDYNRPSGEGRLNIDKSRPDRDQDESRYNTNRPVDESRLNPDRNRPVDESRLDRERPAYESRLNPDRNRPVDESRPKPDRNRPVDESRYDSDHNRPVDESRYHSDHNRPVDESRYDSDRNRPVDDSRLDRNRPAYESRLNPDRSRPVDESRLDRNRPVDESRLNTDRNRPVDDSRLNPDRNRPVDDRRQYPDRYGSVGESRPISDRNRPVDESRLNNDRNRPPVDSRHDSDDRDPLLPKGVPRRGIIYDDPRGRPRGDKDQRRRGSGEYPDISENISRPQPSFPPHSKWKEEREYFPKSRPNRTHVLNTDDGIHFPGTYETSVQLPKVPDCGVKPYELFIAGGEESDEHEWPWMTAIFRRHQGSKPKTFLCGGSLINTRYVLTAAHCFVNNYVILPASSFVVRLGSHYLDSGEEYTVSNLIIHSNHSGSDFFNDIALVRLASEVYVTDKIAPICLPLPDMLRESLVGRMATVAGWGDTAFRTSGTRILQHVVVPVVSSEECFTAYSRVKGAAFLAKGSDHVVCAGLREGGKDACLGDSGGPLMLKTDEDRWVVVGIVSLGYKCAEPGYPGVYTRVTHYMSWIQSNMKRN